MANGIEDNKIFLAEIMASAVKPPAGGGGEGGEAAD